MFKKIFSLFAALTLSAGLWAEGSVFTYTATVKLESQFAGLGTVATHEFKEGTGRVTYDGTVTVIGASAFNACSALLSITIPEGVTTIGEYAFAVCFSLQSVTIPASVTTIDQQAFRVCGALASVTFLGNACQNAIGEAAFYGVGEDAPALLTLPNNWTGSKPVDNKTAWYGGYFNYTAPAKTSVITYTATEKLPETTASTTAGLHLNAFYAADSTQLTVTHTFDEAESVGTITLDGEVAIIGDYAFYNCANTSITLPASVTTIGESSFRKCHSLSSIILPEGLKTIGKRVFEEGYALSTITIPSTVTTIGETAFNSAGLESITFAEGSQLTTIAEGAFFYSTLKSIDIPASVTEIGLGAFQACSALQSVTIAASVTTIGGYAFYNCSVLASVTFLGDACQNAIGEVAFGNVGATTPALLTLPNSWTGTLPDEDGNWYDGKFELSSIPTALPTLFGDGVKGNKFMQNGQLLIRKDGKNYNVLGGRVK